VIALSEQHYFNLADRSSKLGISVLCPGWVKTRIMESERNRPNRLQNETLEASFTSLEEAAYKQMLASVEAGISPEQVAEQVFDAIRTKQLYVLTHQEYNPIIEGICKCRLSGMNPPTG
jgi:short-subunit dehydrogenase